MATCSTTGIRDFPIRNNVPITTTLNDGIKDNSLLLDIQWSSRSTAPQLLANGFIDNSSSQNTTLRLQGNSYILQSIQICLPQHTTLVTADKSPTIGAEIILSFSTTASIAEKYCYICIPINTVSTTRLPEFLEAIRNDVLPGRPITLESLIPADRNFISYSTCLQQTQSSRTSAVQARVLVFVNCLSYPSNYLNRLRSLIPNNLQTYPNVLLPDNVQAKTQANLFTISAEIDYRNYLRYGLLQKTNNTNTVRNTREDTTDAYKCVPLLPSENVKGGKIVVDTTTGVPLSQILKNADNNNNLGLPSNNKSNISPATVEKIIAISFGIGFGLFILSVLAYVISNFTTGNAGPSFPYLQNKLSGLSINAIIGIIGGIIGLIIGISITFALKQ